MHNDKNLFPGQQPNEQIHLVIHQHWMVLAMQLFIWLIFVFMYFALEYINLAYIVPNLNPDYAFIIELLRIAFLMCLLMGFATICILYYLNIHVVTNERIVDIDQPAILKHTISELHLNQMQDVTAEIHGLLENIFNYGDVYIQTAGETERFVFNKIPNPTKVTKIILDLYEKLPEQQKNHHGPLHNSQISNPSPASLPKL